MQRRGPPVSAPPCSSPSRQGCQCRSPQLGQRIHLGKHRHPGHQLRSPRTQDRLEAVEDGQQIRGAARRGQVTRDADLENLYFTFEDVVFQTEEGTLRNKRWEQTIPVSELFASSRRETRKEVITSDVLRFHTIRDPLLTYARKQNPRYLLTYRTEVSTRVALALSSFLFVLVGAPVGMLGRRSSFVGSGLIALLIAFVLYYPLHEIGKNLAMTRILPPEFAMLMPGIAVGGIGLYLTVRVLRQ